MADAYIIDAARTPRGIGKAGKGALTEFHPGRLLAQVFEEIGNRNDLKTEEIDDVVVACSSQVGKQGSCVGRMAALDAGWSDKACGMTLDRFCGSGITSVNIAAANLMRTAVLQLTYCANHQPHRVDHSRSTQLNSN